MTWPEILTAISTLAATAAAVLAYLGKQSIVALQRRHDSSLKQVEDSHNSALRKSEDQQRAALALLQAEHLHFNTLDIDLRDKRMPVYAELWALTGLLPRWPRDLTITFEQLPAFSAALRSWYYTKGGMLLTEATRDAFFDVQKHLAKRIELQRTGLIDDEKDYEPIRLSCSLLRSGLAKDLASRRSGPSTDGPLR